MPDSMILSIRIEHVDCHEHKGAGTGPHLYALQKKMRGGRVVAAALLCVPVLCKRDELEPLVRQRDDVAVGRILIL